MEAIDFFGRIRQATTHKQLLEIMADADEKLASIVDREVLAERFQIKWAELAGDDPAVEKLPLSVRRLLEQGRRQGQPIGETVALIMRVYPNLTEAELDQELEAYARDLERKAEVALTQANKLRGQRRR